MPKVYQYISLFMCFFHAQILAAQNIDNATIENTQFVILVYHHVSTETPPSTSISPQDFSAHLAYLAEHHQVISLQRAMQAITKGEGLPDKSIVITFDDGYANIFTNAYPLLKDYGFPFTVFINPPSIGNSDAQLTWQQIKQMQTLATFANHTLDHAHLLERRDKESKEQWLNRQIHNISAAESQLKEQLGYSKKWLAYPFGEYNNSLKQSLKEQGFIAFAQHSGAVSANTDFGAIPRFPAAGIYANLDTLGIKMQSLAFDMKRLEPKDTMLIQGDSVTRLILEIPQNQDIDLTRLNCFYKGKAAQWTREDSILTVNIPEGLNVGRSRVNCTAPSKALSHRFYWHSSPFFVADAQGKFPN